MGDVKEAAKTRSPTGKAPLLLTKDNAAVFSASSIARYITSLRRDTGLLGETMVEQAVVESWMEWASLTLELPACALWYPVAGFMKATVPPEAYVDC